MNTLLTEMLRGNNKKPKAVAGKIKTELEGIASTFDDAVDDDSDPKKEEAESKKEEAEEKRAAALDAADDYTNKDIKLKTLSVIQQWVETDDLEEGESSADRLLAMMVGIIDSNKDGEVTDDEQELLNIALEYAHDYLDKYGVDPKDSSALLNDWDSAAAERVSDLLAASMPDADGAADEINSMVFDAAADDTEDDGEREGEALDAVYKKKIVVRAGKKVRINKRVSGKVRLSARQKVAIRKAQMKSHRGAAMVKRKKSNKLRKNLGLNK